MSRLVSLRVLGIRSFGPDEEDAGNIKFLSPITLILGQNGCGKTTLIECLKFATCGDVPDNTNRGRDFVYDPHLADDSSRFATKAYVKLKFTDINGDTFLVSRPIQVTQKQKNLEFKRLESVIRLMKPSGESTDLSSRCTDIDNLIISSLGVSKAILNNVIFCHQEDSCWPLDEGKKVKDKFDTIFDAKKYNACLEQIKKIRRERQTELKVMKNELYYLSERRSEASSKRALLSDTESRINAQSSLVKSLKEQIVPVTNRLQEIAEKEDSIGKLRTEYGTYETRLSSVQEMIKDLKSRVNSIFSGSDDELRNALNNFQEEFSKKQEKLKLIDKELQLTESDIHLNKDLEKAEEINFNNFTRDSERLNARLVNLNEVFQDLCSELDLQSQSNLFLDKTNRINDAILSVQTAISEKQDDAADMKSEHEAIIQQLQTEIDNLREEKAKKEGLIDHKKSVIINMHQECDKLRRDIEEVDKSAECLSILETELSEINKKIVDLNSIHDATQLNINIREQKQERSKLEKDLRAVESEVQLIQKLSGFKAEIDVQKDLKKSKEEDIKKLVRRHGESLKRLLGEVPEQGLKIKFQAALSKLSEEVRTRREEIKISERDVTRLESEKRHLLDKLREAKQSLTTDECVIDQECGNKDYDTYLSELSTKVQELQDQKGTLSSSEYMFKRYVGKLEQQDPCCPLCHRDFPNEEDVSNLILELNLKMRELPSKLKTSKTLLEETQEKYNKLLQLKPKFEKLSETKNVTIPTLQTHFERTEEKLDSAQNSLNELTKDLTDHLNNEESAKNIQGDIVLLEQLSSDLKKIDKEIQKLELKLPSGSQRCIEDALEDQELLRSKLNRCRESEESFQTTLNTFTLKKQELQEEKTCLQNQQIKISGNAQMRSQLVEKLRENEKILASTQTEIDENSEILLTVSEKLEKSSSHIKIQLANNMKTLQENISKLNSVERKFNDMKAIQTEIEKLLSSSIKEKLISSKNNIKVLQTKIEHLCQKKEETISEKEELKSVLSSQKSLERNLEDNIKLRAKLTEEKELIEKIKTLKLYIGSADYVSIAMEKNKLRQEEENINRERSQAEGRQRELKNTFSLIKAELDKDIYKNADKNYRDKLINIKVEELSIDDLNKYYIALDWALTQFHQEKMKAINSTIRDLWRQIYKGNDIDAIEIKADVDSSLSADKRRTYNYRVVQKKNNVEMDMRGRCSAGQKVLACLIIRMALAETFSANCGVIALDEPTTNLDQENIHSLSEALIQIVNKRSLQKNFQLIIISHDKAFLEVLQRIDKAEYYYRVSRNEKGRSRIEKLHLHGSDN